MDPEKRLELIAELLGAVPTTSGVFGRETAAAYAVARGEGQKVISDRLQEAKQVGSMAAVRCLAHLPHARNAPAASSKLAGGDDRESRSENEGGDDGQGRAVSLDRAE